MDRLNAVCSRFFVWQNSAEIIKICQDLTELLSICC